MAQRAQRAHSALPTAKVTERHRHASFWVSEVPCALKLELTGSQLRAKNGTARSISATNDDLIDSDNMSTTVLIKEGMMMLQKEQ